MLEGSLMVKEPDVARPFLEIRVLGPVQVLWADRPIDVGGLRARALVARLLIDRTRTVPVDRLLDAFWPDLHGDSAENALRTTVSRLRKRLRDAGVEVDLIETRALGYALNVEAEATDVCRFEELVAAGRHQLARRDPGESIRLLQEAESLWRGAAYSDVGDELFARTEARRLEELRLIALETRFDAEMTLGCHDHIVGELEWLTGANPMRERLWSQRMLALYRSGRQAEALRVFQELREILIGELGIEPGHDAQWLEQAMLEQRADLDWVNQATGNPDRPPVQRILASGDVLFNQGQPGELIYFVESGSLEVYRELPDGSERPLSLVTEGSYVGELGPILNLPRSASVRALEDSVVVGVTVSAFRKRHPHSFLQELE